MGITTAQFLASGQRASGEPAQTGLTSPTRRYGGIGRRAGFRFQCFYNVEVQVLLPTLILLEIFGGINYLLEEADSIHKTV